MVAATIGPRTHKTEREDTNLRNKSQKPKKLTGKAAESASQGQTDTATTPTDKPKKP